MLLLTVRVAVSRRGRRQEVGYLLGDPDSTPPTGYPPYFSQYANRRAKGRAGGRPPVFDQAIYARRDVVERCFAHLKQFRGLATRYTKRAAYYRAEVVIAAIALWLR